MLSMAATTGTAVGVEVGKGARASGVAEGVEVGKGGSSPSCCAFKRRELSNIPVRKVLSKRRIPIKVYVLSFAMSSNNSSMDGRNSSISVPNFEHPPLLGSTLYGINMPPALCVVGRIAVLSQHLIVSGATIQGEDVVGTACAKTETPGERPTLRKQVQKRAPHGKAGVKETLSLREGFFDSRQTASHQICYYGNQKWAKAALLDSYVQLSNHSPGMKGLSEIDRAGGLRALNQFFRQWLLPTRS